jgi:hypothetical protein
MWEGVGNNGSGDASRAVKTMPNPVASPVAQGKIAAAPSEAT